MTPFYLVTLPDEPLFLFKAWLVHRLLTLHCVQLYSVLCHLSGSSKQMLLKTLVLNDLKIGSLFSPEFQKKKKKKV